MHNSRNFVAKSTCINNSYFNESSTNNSYRNDINDTLIKVRVEGLLTSIAFQRARLSALKLYQHLPFQFALPSIRGMFQIDWQEHLQKIRSRIGGKIWALERQVAVFINDEFLGSDVDFQRYISQTYVFSLPGYSGYYENIVREHLKECIDKSGASYLNYRELTCTLPSLLTLRQSDPFYLCLSDKLYSDLLPHTCQHFLSLCVGDKGQTLNEAPLSYKNTCVHRIVSNGWLQCGVLQFKDTESNCNENGGALIPDESYCIPHNRRGVLSMANDGKHSNGSQFIVCLKPNSWMDYYYVAFGQLVDGAEALKTIESIPTTYEKPLKRIVVSQCGEYHFDDEPRMEAGPDVFLRHVPQSTLDGECQDPCQYAYPGYPGINPWLDNIVDKLDNRDTVSLLMAERYLNGLYCLATDYLSGMDMNIGKPDHSTSKTRVKLSLRCICDICDSSASFRTMEMTKNEKISLIQKAGKEIITSALDACEDEATAERVTIDTAGTARWILEVANEVITAAVAKSKKAEANAETTDVKDFSESIEPHKVMDKQRASEILEIVDEVLNEALLYVVDSGKTETNDSLGSISEEKHE